MTKIKNKRLSNADRQHILDFAKGQIEQTECSKKLDETYDEMADHLHSVILAQNPTRDMKVLRKYNAAVFASDILIDEEFHQLTRFSFRKDDKRIILRSKLGGNVIQLSNSGDKTYQNYRKAEADWTGKVKSRLADFQVLVQSVTNFNSLSESWPAVEALRPAIVGSSTALSLLSEDMIKRIEADKVFSPTKT